MRNYLSGAFIIFLFFSLSVSAQWSKTGSNVYLTTTTDVVGLGVTIPAGKLDVAGPVVIGMGYAGTGITPPSNGLLVEGEVGIGVTVTSSSSSPGYSNKLQIAQSTTGYRDRFGINSSSTGGGTGTNNNVAGYFSAINAPTNNYGLFVQNGSVLFTGSGETPTAFDGTSYGSLDRFMWVPEKKSLRFGTPGGVLGTTNYSCNWDASNIGNYSFAGGEGSFSPGDKSMAYGYYCNASGNRSVALGSESWAQHDGSFVFADVPGSTQYQLLTSGGNQFLARAKGGFYFRIAEGLSYGSFSEIQIKANGNVANLGIGMTPSYPLDVNGDVRISSLSGGGPVVADASGKLILSGSSANFWSTTGNTITPALNYLGSLNAADIIFKTSVNFGGGERMKIKAEGGVGIGDAGNTYPSLFNVGNDPISTGVAQFRVDYNGAVSIFQNRTGTALSDPTLTINKDGKITILKYDGTTNQTMFYADENGHVDAKTLTSPEITTSKINVSGGNLGIGISSPNEILDVNGPVYLEDVSTTFHGVTNRLYNEGSNLYWNNSLVLTKVGNGLFEYPDPVTGIYEVELGGPLNNDVEINTTNAGSDYNFFLTGNGRFGIGTNVPEAKFHMNNGALLLTGTTGGTPTDASGNQLGTGTRFMWIPAKGALRAGNVYGTAWNDANIGNNSVALGAGGTASGDASFSLGTGYASGNGSFASNLGRATGYNSLAMGEGCEASGDNSVVIGGYSSGAYGLKSEAFGSDAFSTGDYSFTMGNDVTASGDNSIAIGNGLTASGNYSTAIGKYVSTDGYSGSIALGDACSGSIGGRKNWLPNQFVSFYENGYFLFSDCNSWGNYVYSDKASNGMVFASSRNRKENIREEDGEIVLSKIAKMPITNNDGLIQSTKFSVI